MNKSSWIRLVVAGLGVASVVVAFFVPPAAVALGPLSGALIGYAMKAPGTVTVEQMQSHGKAIAQAVVPAVHEAVIANAGKAPAQIATAAATAAANAASNAIALTGGK